jgi:hypothetical protein
MGNDLYHWLGTIEVKNYFINVKGPPDSPYEGLFHILKKRRSFSIRYYFSN